MSRDSKNSEISLEHVLCRLDRWRHLPAYQLERRADVFFALFLPEVLEEHFGAKNIHLIPEFPIKKSLLSGDTTSKSLNVDFLAVEEEKSGGPRQAFLVELKTDMASRGEKQAIDLSDAVEVGLKGLVEGVIEIAGVTASRHKQKYVHLLHMLSELGLVEYQDDLFDVIGTGEYRKVLDRMKEKVQERAEYPSLKLVYIQPREPKTATIDFDKFAKVIQKRDGIRKTFADYLIRWVHDAGLPNPNRSSR